MSSTHLSPVILFVALGLVARSAAAQRPPSQMELNGFLIGQHRQTLDRALGRPFQADTFPDGWTDRVYMIDRALHAYMAFKFDASHPDYAFSVQIAGRPGTPMRPFLGLRLGAPRSEVLARAGRPSKVTPEPELQLELLEYNGRNYSFEVDSQGLLSSIQIYGYDGFSELPAANEPDPLTRFRAALAETTIDSLLTVLAPDIEFYRDSTTLTFQRAARSDLEDPASPVWRALFADGTGLRGAVQSAPSSSALRILDNGITGRVYIYESGPVRELFFTWIPGGYRLWEVRLR